MKDILKWVAFGGLFLVPLLPLFVADSLFFPYITGKNFAFRIIVEVVVAAWAVLALMDARYRPRFSWALAAFVAFTGIVLLADLLGVAPEKSLWSNFERMEGFVTIAHLFGYFLVAGVLLADRTVLRRFFQVSLGAAVLVAVYAFAQLAGAVDIQQGGLRIDATLGNAIYMAIYMFFSAVLALYLLATERDLRWRVGYGVLAAAFVFLLFATATRGTILGLAAGVAVAASYGAYAARGNRTVRRIALSVLVLLMLAGGSLYAARDAAFVAESPLLSRIASISLEAGSTRFTIWSIALEGFAERPLLGWGQENFNYVFNEHYDPSLYSQEPWFDRVHNVYLDWLIATGVLGFLSYLALWGAALFALVRGRGVGGSVGGAFSPAERAVLLGAFVGYAVHSVFVFDNLISYFFFATLLALVHARTATSEPLFSSVRVRETIAMQVVLPVAVLTLALVVYTVNVPHIRAARDLIQALGYTNALVAGSQPTQEEALAAHALGAYRDASSRGSFATQEISEQLALAAQRVATSLSLSAETKVAFASYADEQMAAFVATRPEDARAWYFHATLLGVTGEAERAAEAFATALAHSPQKQQILLDAGASLIDAGRYDEATELIERALALAPKNETARAYAIAVAIYRHDDARVAELAAPPHDQLYVLHPAVLQTYYRLGRYEEALAVIEARLAATPQNLSLLVTKAQVQFQAGRRAGAVATIEDAIELFPGFAAQGAEIIAEFQAAP